MYQKRRFSEHDRQQPTTRLIRINRLNSSSICTKNVPFRYRAAPRSLAGRRRRAQSEFLQDSGIYNTEEKQDCEDKRLVNYIDRKRMPP
jgi:hypothetical protein